jgi:hypothetical protein
MKRITFEEYQKAIEIVNSYKKQCETDLSLIEVDNDLLRKNLKEVEIGQIIKVVKDVKPAKYFTKGDTFKVLDKNKVRGLQIRHKQGNVYWIPFSNVYGRWGF